MTSNLGSSIINEKSKDEAKEDIERLMEQTFRPEFINRINATVIYNPLSKKVMGKIVDIQLQQIRKVLKDKEIDFEITKDAKSLLAKKGYDPVYGARPMKRLIDNVLLDEIAFQIIEGKISEGDKVVVNANEKKKFDIDVVHSN